MIYWIKWQTRVFVTLAGFLGSSAFFSYSTVPVDASIKSADGAPTSGPASVFPNTESAGIRSSHTSAIASRQRQPCFHFRFPFIIIPFLPICQAAAGYGPRCSFPTKYGAESGKYSSIHHDRNRKVWYNMST